MNIHIIRAGQYINIVPYHEVRQDIVSEFGCFILLYGVSVSFPG